MQSLAFSPSVAVKGEPLGRDELVLHGVFVEATLPLIFGATAVATVLSGTVRDGLEIGGSTEGADE